MNRLLRRGGTMLVADQLAPVDSLAAIELNRFERARDPSTTRILADVDLRGLFDANSLVLRHAEIISEEPDLERHFDLAACHGDERERARALAPHGASAPDRLSTSSANPASKSGCRSTRTRDSTRSTRESWSGSAATGCVAACRGVITLRTGRAPLEPSGLGRSFYRNFLPFSRRRPARRSRVA